MSGELPLFWHWWVVGLTIIGLIFLLLLLVRVYFPAREHGREYAEEDVTWDEDLSESSAVPPKWWFWLMLASLFFSVLYLIFYPGLGNYKGLFDLTTAKQFSESKERIDNKYQPKLALLEALDTAQLQQHPALNKLATNLFKNNCANCHGQDARGQADTFPNLKDADWQWGGSTAQISDSITNGRNAAMPGWEIVLGGEQEVASMAALVRDFNANKEQPAYQQTHAKYLQFCAACHAATGTGNPALGAPNLTDNIWLYGGDAANIQQSIATGRNGVMPPHKTRLTTLQIKLLAAWLSQE